MTSIIIRIIEGNRSGIDFSSYTFQFSNPIFYYNHNITIVMKKLSVHSASAPFIFVFNQKCQLLTIAFLLIHKE